MRRFWVVRHDRKNSAYFYDQLVKGRLRQGWGYLPEQNLNVIREKLEKAEVLSDPQRSAWNGNRRLHQDEHDSIQIGDIIISPNLPEEGNWLMSGISGNYLYDIDPKLGDYGHCRPAEVLNIGKPIHPYSRFTSARLRKTMRSMSRMWNIDAYRLDVEDLIDALRKGSNVSTSEDETEKLCDIKAKAITALHETFIGKYHGQEFERPVHQLLNKVYTEVEHLGGPGEKGADFLCTQIDELGIPHKIVVQVKMWEGKANWIRPIEQIEQAIQTYAPSGAIILTTATEATPEFNNRLKEIESTHGLQPRLICAEELMSLFLKYLPEIVEDMGMGKMEKEG